MKLFVVSAKKNMRSIIVSYSGTAHETRYIESVIEDIGNDAEEVLGIQQLQPGAYEITCNIPSDYEDAPYNVEISRIPHDTWLEVLYCGVYEDA